MSTITPGTISSNTNNQRYGYSFDSIYNTMLKPQIYGEYIKYYGKGVGLLEMLYLMGSTTTVAGTSKTVWEEGSLTKLVELASSKQEVTTDADGRFTVQATGKTWFISAGGRAVGDENESYLWIKGFEPAEDEYPGDVDYRMEFAGEKGDPFPFVFLDPETLEQVASAQGWQVEFLARNGEDGYLSRLTRR